MIIIHFRWKLYQLGKSKTLWNIINQICNKKLRNGQIISFKNKECNLLYTDNDIANKFNDRFVVTGIVFAS